jgi:hypothetical protein
VTQYHEDTAAEMFDGVLDAAYADCVGDVSCRTDYKEVAQALIEQNLRGNTTVRAGENHYIRVLIFCKVVAERNQLAHPRLACNKSFVPLHQIRPNLAGRPRLIICARMMLRLLCRSYGRLLRSPRENQ